MAITKVTRTLLSTGIVDNSNATAITIDSSENLIMTAGGTIRAGGANDLILDAGESGTPDIYLQSGGSTKVKIEGSNGNVGIGCTPSRILDVEVSGGNAIGSVVSGTSSIAGFVFGDTSADDQGGVLYDNSSDFLYYRTGGSERMRISGNGRTSIGTTTTNAGLTVANGDIRTTAAAFANDANSMSMSQESGGGFIVARGPGGSTRGTISLSVNEDGGGGGLIGLKIESNAAVYLPNIIGFSGANSDVRYDTSSGQIYYQTSSQRYKSEITNLEDSLNKIQSLRPVRFKDNHTEKFTIGLIAEEVVDIIPEVVFKKNIDGFDEQQPEGINYSDITPFLIKAIQEQQTVIEDLKSRIETLEG